jgi:hypothetical protein
MSGLDVDTRSDIYSTGSATVNQRRLTSAATIEGADRARARGPGLDRHEVSGERSHAAL